MKVHQISPQSHQHYESQNLGFEVAKTIDLIRDKGFTVGFAESCTGGLLSSEVTKISGVSDIFVGSVVCYSNSVKENVLGVNPETLKNHGAVSAECASELSVGVLKTLSTKLAVAITGIAGPAGGSVTKPVGTVFISVSGVDSVRNQIVTKIYCRQFGQIENSTLKLTEKVSRGDIQKRACSAALEHLQELIQQLKK